MCWPTRKAGLEQRAGHPTPLPVPLALAQRGQDRHVAHHAAHDVDHRRAGAQRLAGWTGHICQPGHELHYFIERWPVLVGPWQEALQRAIDQPKIDRVRLLPAQAEPLHSAGCEILDQHVGAAQQIARNLVPGRRLQVDADAPFVTIEIGEEPGGEAVQPARAVAVGSGFDADHVGAEIRQHHAAGGPHDGMREFENHQSFKRQDRHG